MKPTNLEQPVFNRIGKSVFTRAVLGEWQRIGVDIQVRFLDALLERSSAPQIDPWKLKTLSESGLKAGI